ncbi:hypothetical protein LTR56_017841 [Elasticomyces elasticus]|nr:hypothetical protein LTR22_025607 [Elasticomyces elasticus]KAK3629828.1 hypothetical protein LTR56_017841 [Elasticomyces elasticus]KAK4917522.1 hypothetical protein LTR49_014608 [Elasticomyces elasticus]KAK5756354.1 hypothetical protein LTS12_013543 [Elasticomyces elasticus]
MPVDLTTDSSSTHGNASASPFLSLPPEMRNRIYEYAMTVGTIYVQLGRETGTIRGFTINEHSGVLSQHDRRLKLVKSPFAMHKDSALQPAGGSCLSLLRTCKQVNKEAAKMFIVCNSFEVQAFDTDSSLAENGMVCPGLFIATVKPTSIVAAIPRFLTTIGILDAKLLTEVTLHLGQLDDTDADNGDPHALVNLKQFLDQLRNFQTSNPSWRLKMGVALRIDLSEIAQEVVEFEEMVLDVRAPLSGVKATSEAINDRARLPVSKQYVTDQLDAYGSFLRIFQEAIETWNEAIDSLQNVKGSTGHIRHLTVRDKGDLNSPEVYARIHSPSG